MVEFESPGASLLHMRVLSAQGQLVFEQTQMSTTAVTQNVPIDIQQLSPGIYFLEVRDSSDRIVRKFVKK